MNEEFKAVAKRNIEGVDSSALFMSLYSPDAQDDPMVMIQIGAAVMKDKPIALLAIKGVKIPQHLRTLAFHIEEVEKVDSVALRQAADRIMAAAKEKKII